MSDDCIFCKIAQETATATVVYQDDKVMAFHDIHPKARVHLLLIPRKHIKSLMEVDKTDAELISHMLLTLPMLAKKQGLGEGFKTIIFTGAKGGQEIDHLHFHLMGS